METEILQFNNADKGGRDNGEEFYETIEAPKFVDLSAPDHYQPGDDRYWFCMRAGCDQNHEEELDSEAIYKNFVLRVMAARSPNIRLRKALYRKDSSLKCPQTVPPKSSKPRISRLALISSTSKRIIDPKVKVKTHCKQNATPNAKEKRSAVKEKVLITPRNKKKISNLDVFGSSRNPRATATAEPKNRVVAKALVFSPKKLATTKTPLKDGMPIKTLCEGVNKLEITKGKKHVLGYNRPLPSEKVRKQQRGREVKSRVFDGLLSQNPKREEPKCRATNQESFEYSNTTSNDDKITNNDRKINCAVALDNKEEAGHVTEFDDNKENALAPDVNRETNPDTGHVERKIAGKPKPTKDTQKGMNKSNGEILMAAQMLKQKKPKPTNPKPFRLRTDERGIIKETTFEKKQPIPSEELTPGPSVLAQKKQQNASQKNENIHGVKNNVGSCIEKDEQKNVKKPKERVGRFATPVRHTVSSKQKLVASHGESAKKLGSSSMHTKSPFRRKTIGLKGAANTKPTVSNQLDEVKEASPSATSTLFLPRKTTRTIPRESEFHYPCA